MATVTPPSQTLLQSSRESGGRDSALPSLSWRSAPGCLRKRTRSLSTRSQHARVSQETRRRMSVRRPQQRGEVLIARYRWETNQSHMARIATEARSRTTAQWISDHVGPQRKYKPPRRKGLRRRLLTLDMKVSCWPFLPADVRACRNWPIPKGQHQQGGRRQVLVARKWEAIILAPSLYRISGMDASDQKVAERKA